MDNRELFVSVILACVFVLMGSEPWKCADIIVLLGSVTWDWVQGLIDCNMCWSVVLT